MATVPGFTPIAPPSSAPGFTPLAGIPEEQPLLALPGELGLASDEIEQSARSIQKTTKLMRREQERAVTTEQPSGAIGTTGVVIGEPPADFEPTGGKEQFKRQVGQVETLEDLQQIIQSEGATMRNVLESQVLANRTKRPVDYKAIPPPLSEEPIQPGLLQKTVDYLTRPISAIAGAEKAAVQGGDVGQAVKDALSGRTKTFSGEALEAAGVPEGPPLVDIKGGLGFGAGAPAPIETTLAKVTPRGVAGAVLDVVQDPTTYLSLGTGRGLRLATGEVLNRSGVKALEREIASNVAGGLTREEARTAAESTVAAAARRAGWLDKGGIKFFGRAIPGTDVAQDVARDALKRAALAAQSTEAGARLTYGAKKIASVFDRDVMVRGYGDYVRDKQRYLNRVIADREDIVDAASVLFKGTTEQERKALTYAIEHRALNGNRFLDPSGQPLDARLERVALSVDNAQMRLRAEEAALGLGDTFHDDYMMHAYSNYPKLTSRGPLGGVTPSLTANLERKIPTLEEAKTLGLKPISEDAMHLFVLRQIASSRARRAKELIEQTGTKFGREGMSLPQRIAENFVEAPNFRTPEGAPLFIPRELAEDVATLGPKPSGPVLRAFDAAQNIWKGSVTSVFVPFHVRNATTNVINSFLDIGLQAANPIRHGEALAVMHGATGELVTRLGERYSYEELKKLFRAEALEGAFGGKIGLEITRGGKVLGDMPPLSWGRAVGNEVEGEARMLHFLAGIRRGLTPEEAAKRTKKVLFDYENVSPTERTVLRRLFPFWTFTRKNVPYQVGKLATEPGRQSVIAKAFATPGDQAQIEKDARMWPEYVSSGLAIKVGKDQRGDDLILWGTGLPIEDLNRVIPQKREGKSMLEELTRKNALTLLHPLAKFIIEEVANKDLWQDRPLDQVNKIYDAYGPVIDKLPDSIKDYLHFKKELTRRGDARYTMDPTALHLVRSFILSRLYSTAGKQFDTRKDAGTRWLNNLTGMRLGSLEAETQIYPALKQRAEEREKASAEEKTLQRRAVIFDDEPAASPAEIESLRTLGFTDDQLRAEGLVQ